MGLLYLITYLRFSLEKFIFIQLVNKRLAFMKPETLLPISYSPILLSVRPSPSLLMILH
jgi:hypothetical protein